MPQCVMNPGDSRPDALEATLSSRAGPPYPGGSITSTTMSDMYMIRLLEINPRTQRHYREGMGEDCPLSPLLL
jgi:hypothetical protein